MFLSKQELFKMSKKRFGNSIDKNVSNYVYGRLPSLNSLLNNKAVKAFVHKGFDDSRILNLIKEKRIPMQQVELEKLDMLSNRGNHQGVVLEVKPFEYSDLDSIISISKKKKSPLVLILDEIEDPHNFGAIIRSADAFGVDGIIIKNRNQVPINMTVTKVSTGAIEYVKIAQVSNLTNAIERLKAEGFWVYAADGEGKDYYNNLKYDGPIALVVGSEGNGISRLVLNNSDFIIKIPMEGHVNSLNVSVATGILLSRIRNK